MITQPTCPECNVRVRSWFCLALRALGTGHTQLRNKSIQLKVNTGDATSISPYESLTSPITVSRTLSCAVCTSAPCRRHHSRTRGRSCRFTGLDCGALRESCDLPKTTQLKSGRTRVKVQTQPSLESHGCRSLIGCSPWGRTESDTTEAT